MNMWLRQTHCLHNDVINTSLEFVCLQVAVVSTHLAEYELVGAFTPDTIISFTHIFHEVGRFLIDSVVCQMHL